MLLITTLVFAFLSVAFSWSPRGEYIPPGDGDWRSPCPALNTLANYNELPRTGWFSRAGFRSAVKRVFNTCPDLPDVVFELAYLGPVPSKGFPFPVSEIFSLGALGVRPWEATESSYGRVDPIDGNITEFSEEIWAQTISFSTDGVYMTFDDFRRAHKHHIKRSTARYGRDKPNPQAIGVMSGNTAFIWHSFAGGKPIKISDLKEFFLGRFPEGWTPGPPFCVAEWLKTTIDVWKPSYVPLPKLAYYPICKKLFGTAKYSTLCEDNFVHLPFIHGKKPHNPSEPTHQEVPGPKVEEAKKEGFFSSWFGGKKEEKPAPPAPAPLTKEEEAVKNANWDNWWEQPHHKDEGQKDL